MRSVLFLLLMTSAAPTMAQDRAMWQVFAPLHETRPNAPRYTREVLTPPTGSKTKRVEKRIEQIGRQIGDIPKWHIGGGIAEVGGSRDSFVLKFGKRW